MRKAATNSFEVVAREWHATVHASQVSAGHAARTLTRLEQDVFPWLGALPIGDIRPPQLLQVVRRVEDRGAIRAPCAAGLRAGVPLCHRDRPRRA